MSNDGLTPVPDDLGLLPTLRGYAGLELFNRYRLERILGRGGMGVVWLARDEQLERDVALKFLPDLVSADPEAIADLKRETKRSLALNHHHIVRIYDFVQDATQDAVWAGISMEYIDGKTLSALKVVQLSHCFGVEELTPWIRQLLDALDYAHTRAKVVHRDLKPANLMINSAGELKVADFGIARSLSDSVSRVSVRGGASGTLAYMSPQQAMGRAATMSDDIYALGATIFDLIAGKAPFHSGDILAQLREITAPSMTQRRAELGVEGQPIPREWEEVVAACLAKDPRERPKSVREVARRLRLPLAETLGTNEPDIADEGDPATPHRPRRIRKVLFGVSCTAMLLALVACGYYFGVEKPAEAKQIEQLRQEAVRASQQAQQSVQEAQQAGSAAEQSAAQARTSADQAKTKEVQDAASQAEQASAQAKEAVKNAQKDADSAAQAAANFSQQTTVATAGQLAQNAQEAAQQATQSAQLAQQNAQQATAAAAKVDAAKAAAAAAEAQRLANARGGVMVNTDPPGATIALGGEDVQTSPATFKSLHLGTYPVHITLEGYEPVDQQVEVKENQFTDLGTITLVHSKGSLTITSTPRELPYTISQNGLTLRTGTTPATETALPTGSYDISVSNGDWEKKDTIVIKRNEMAGFFPEFLTGSLQITSEPSNALATVNGKEEGRTPLTVNNLKPGDVTIDLKLEDYKSSTTTATVTANNVTSITEELKPSVPPEARPYLGTYTACPTPISTNVHIPAISIPGVPEPVDINKGSFRIFLDDDQHLAANGTVVSGRTIGGNVVFAEHARITGIKVEDGRAILTGQFSYSDFKGHSFTSNTAGFDIDENGGALKITDPSGQMYDIGISFRHEK